MTVKRPNITFLDYGVHFEDNKEVAEDFKLPMTQKLMFWGRPYGIDPVAFKALGPMRNTLQSLMIVGFLRDNDMSNHQG